MIFLTTENEAIVDASQAMPMYLYKSSVRLILSVAKINTPMMMAKPIMNTPNICFMMLLP